MTALLARLTEKLAGGPQAGRSDSSPTSKGPLEWVDNNINSIVKEVCIPDDCRKSIMVPVYKGKSDPLVCGLYRAIKLLEQQMKVFESVGKEDKMLDVN